MDFEKAYKESFEAAKGLHDAGNALTKKQMEIVFPQLAESEDERIRKALIEVFKEKLERGFEWVEYGIPNRSVLSWLEKQKDASKAIEAVEKIDKYIDEHLANAHDMKDSNPDKKYYRGWDDALGKMAGILQDVYSGEKQKEQKHPNGCFTCDEYKKGYEEGRRNGFTAGYNKAMKEIEQKEQKPVVTHGETYRVDTLGTQQVIAGKMPQKPAEWSEEDEMYLSQAIETLEHENYSILADKLKSLRNRVGKEFLQPHWKPSEDEERLINTSISFLKDFADKGYENAVECIDWLKSKLNGNSGK